MATTLDVVPVSEELLGKSGLPFGAIIHPMADSKMAVR